MIFGYSVHDRGTSHSEDGLPCQDSFSIADCGEGFKVAAVADGLGSCKNSGVASKIVVEEMTRFVREYFPRKPSEASLVSLMITAMNSSENTLLRKISEQGMTLEECHTTLSACIFGEGTTVFGHSGDGAIVGLRSDGTYRVICEPIKGKEPNSTAPFTYGSDYWKAGVAEEGFVSVMLMTDGVADVVYPPYLRPQHEVLQDHATFFMHPAQLGIKGNAKDESISEKLGGTTLAAIRDPGNHCWSEVTDDITAVMLIDTESDPPELESVQDEEYLRKKMMAFYRMPTDGEPEVSRDLPPSRVAPDSPTGLNNAESGGDKTGVDQRKGKRKKKHLFKN